MDLEAGDFAAERVRIKTPQPSTPEAVAGVFVELLASFADSTGSVGVTVPAVVRHGVVSSAANIDAGWIGTDADALFTKATGRDVHVVNDADAAGLAEVRYGAAKGRGGLVIVTTLGTGIGSAILYDGVLVPNSELGHLEIDGHDAEKRAASSVKELEGLSYPEWAKRLTVYYRTLEKLFSPDLFVVGGGVSKDADEFMHLIDIETEIVPAKLREPGRHRGGRAVGRRGRRRALARLLGSQGLLDVLAQVGGLGPAVAGDHRAVAADEELGEVPVDLAADEHAGLLLALSHSYSGCASWPLTSILANIGNVTP